MKILYILKHNPWGIGGGCYACRNYLELFNEIFKEAKFDILICEEYTKDIKEQDFHNCKFISVSPRNKVSKYLSPVTKILHRHQKVATKLLKENVYDYCIFDHNSIAGSLVGLCKKKGIKTIVLNHNCEIEYFKDSHHGYQNVVLLPVVKQIEKKSYLHCDYNIFLTDDDSALFERIYGKSKTKSIIGGCFFKKGENFNIHRNANTDINHIKFVISGSMDNFQNIDGINYFLDSLYKYIPDNTEVILTGKNPSLELQEKVRKLKNVRIIANPDNILNVVKECDIYLCTTKQGGGLKLRIMDGIKCNLPIISHKVSSRGYSDIEKSGLLISFETEKEFENCVKSMISLLKKNNNILESFSICKEKLTFEYKKEFFKNIFN